MGCHDNLVAVRRAVGDFDGPGQDKKEINTALPALEHDSPLLQILNGSIGLKALDLIRVKHGEGLAFPLIGIAGIDRVSGLFHHSLVVLHCRVDPVGVL